MSQLGLEKFMSPTPPTKWVHVEAQPLEAPANAGDFWLSPISATSAQVSVKTTDGWLPVGTTHNKTYYPCCPCCDEESEGCDGSHWSPCGEHQ